MIGHLGHFVYLVRKKVRRYRAYWRMAGSLRRLANAHERCCGAGASWATRHFDWTTAEFGGYAVDQAYREAERLGCSLAGWQRRLVVLYWIARRLGLTW